MDGISSTFAAGHIAELAILGTIFGLVVRSWSSIKGFIVNLWGMLVIRSELDDEITTKAVLNYLIPTYKRSKYGSRIFGGRCDSFRDGKHGHIPFELLGSKNIQFWNGWIPFWFVVQEKKTEDGKNGGGSGVIYWGTKPKPEVKASLMYIRGTLNPELIVREASRGRNQIHWSVPIDKRFFVKKVPDPKQSGVQRFSAGTDREWFQDSFYKLLDHDPRELGRPTMYREKKATENLYFPPHVQELVQEVQTWHGLKEWYAERGIPWKRGWCLYGPPGTGKTVLVRAIAEDLDMPLFVFSLGHMLDEDLERSWEEMQAHTPCVALFEDFDTVFKGRENIYGKATISDQIAATKPDATQQANLNLGRLSFGCLLNCIDGVEKTGGIFTIFTTNHIDTLDPALGQPRENQDGTIDFVSTRPGRIDKAIKLGYMLSEDKLQLAKRIFFDNEEGYRKMEQIVLADPNKDETPAQFQEKCAQLALQLLWKKNNPQPQLVGPTPSRNGHKKIAKAR